MRTRPTPTTSISRTWGTSSGFGGEDYQGPEDLTDVVGIDVEIPRSGGRSAGLPNLPTGRSGGGGGIDLSKPGPAPFEGMQPKRGPARSPIGLEVSKSAGGGLNVTVSVPVGGPISGRGGLNVGKDGAIKGAQVGLGVGAGPISASIDVGTDQDKEGKGGCYQYVTVSLGPFSHTYGRNVCEPPTTPTPTPTPYTQIPPEIPPTKWLPPGGIDVKGIEGCTLKIKWRETYTGINPYGTTCELWLSQGAGYPEGLLGRPPVVKVISQTCNEQIRNATGLWGMQTIFTETIFECEINIYIPKNTSQQFLYEVLNYCYYYYVPSTYRTYNWSLSEYGDVHLPIVNGRQVEEPTLSVFGCEKPKENPIIYAPVSEPNSSEPLIPPNPPIRKTNPPIRKRTMENECCQILALYAQEQLRLMGRPLGPQGQLVPIPENTYFNTEIERVNTPIENIDEPEKIKIKFDNFYELLMYGVKQQINLDVGIDPQSFIAPSGKLQNPKYQRDSEESLKSNNQPDSDTAGNKRELEIGKDIKINSLVEQLQYVFDAIKRLEYLFPSGELDDAKFKKSLIIPGAEGELKIHNLIHFKEFLIQFLNSTLGNPKIPIKIEDTNAIKEGKQSATFNHFSISHMIREMYKLILESGDDINTIMETAVRDFRTNLANRIQIVQIAEMAQALVEDTGMLESQEFIPIKLEGDPYAGKWKRGMGFQPDTDLDSNTEAATEKLLKATLKNFEAEVKVIRRDKRENADIRDLLVQLSASSNRAFSIPATKEGVDKALAIAKYKVKVDNALSRTQIKRAAAAKLSRTKKRKRA